jgi:hypothetical protein
VPQESAKKGDEHLDKAGAPAQSETSVGASIDPSSGYQFFVDPNHGTVSGYSYGLTTDSTGIDLNAGLPDWFGNTNKTESANDNFMASTATATPGAPIASYTEAVPASQDFEAIAAYNRTPDFDLQSSSAFMSVSPVPVPSPNAQSQLEPVETPTKPQPLTEIEPSLVSEPAAIEPVWMPRTVDDSQLRSYKTPQAAKKSLVSLYLRQDERYKNLTLPEDMEVSVSRIFGLVDLDFNGYVEFDEMHRVLESDDLSLSEKGIVKLVLNEARKILIERKLPEEGALVALTREDFKLAFAREYASLFVSMGIKSPSVIPDVTAAPAINRVAFKAQLYGDPDYPLSSIKAGAVSVGTIGDPYFACVIAALAVQDPRAILRIVRTNLDHSFSIAFAGSHKPPFDVMPPRTDELVEYGRTDTFGFWYPLIEKSFGIYQAKQTGLAGHLKSDKSRSESLSRVTQIYEVVLARQVQQSVLADANPFSIFEMLVDMFAQQKVILAVAKDEIDPSIVRLARYPKASKPYPVIAIDSTQRILKLGQIYNHDVEPIECSIDQFGSLFKLLYFSRDKDPKSLSLDAPVSGDNPWKRIP